MSPIPIGLDLAKSVFQVHGIYVTGAVAIRGSSGAQTEAGFASARPRSGGSSRLKLEVE